MRSPYLKVVGKSPVHLPWKPHTALQVSREQANATLLFVWYRWCSCRRGCPSASPNRIHGRKVCPQVPCSSRGVIAKLAQLVSNGRYNKALTSGPVSVNILNRIKVDNMTTCYDVLFWVDTATSVLINNGSNETEADDFVVEFYPSP